MPLLIHEPRTEPVRHRECEPVIRVVVRHEVTPVTRVVIATHDDEENFLESRIHQMMQVACVALLLASAVQNPDVTCDDAYGNRLVGRVGMRNAVMHERTDVLS